MKITSRMPRAEYDAIDALNISRLKNMKRSPLHYRHALTQPHVSAPLTLGTATHVATLEPERFDSDYAIWNRKTESGKNSPRNGKAWDEFQATASACKKSVLTLDEAAEAQAIAASIRANELAMQYLSSGDPEVTLECTIDGRARKGRVDWLLDGHIIGLKTARDCRHFAFGAQSAKLGYHLQWAWYFDLYHAIKRTQPAMMEIVVESAPPYAVAVYAIGPDIIDQGRDEYIELLKLLDECELTDKWPGPVPQIEWLSLPTWAYPAIDDLNELGLETA